MDSITQFALGASVGMAVLGPKTGARKAALVGGVLGTLPDLDVLWPHDNPVDAFILHRSVTHSLVIHALAAPLIGEGLRRVFSSLRDAPWLTYAAVFLCFATHALLDATTIYGTRLFWPLWHEPLALASVFIVDPAYTLPLLGLTVWAMFVRQWSSGVGRAVAVVLIISTAYLGWAAAAQQLVLSRAAPLLAGWRIKPEAVVATPTPFNTLFWRIIAVERARYINIYMPFFSGPETITAYAHSRWPRRGACWVDAALERPGPVRRVAEFAKGFYQIRLSHDDIEMADLRMGLRPNFAFRFALAKIDGAEVTETPPRRTRGARSSPGDFDWLWAGMQGRRALRPAEVSLGAVLSPTTPPAAIPSAEGLCQRKP